MYYLERRFSDTHLQTIISIQVPVVPPAYNEESHGKDWRLVSQCYPPFFIPGDNLILQQFRLAYGLCIVKAPLQLGVLKWCRSLQR